MVVERTMNNRRIIYKCDRCETRIIKPYKIDVQTPKEVRAKRKWDLCERCFEALERGIKKGKNEKIKIN